MLRTLAGMPAPERRAVTASLGIDSDGSDEELSVIIDYTGDPQTLRDAGVTIRSCVAGIITATIPAASVDAIADLPGIKYVQLDKRLIPMLDASVPDTHASNVRSGIAPNWTGYTGRGVVIGSVDTGVDVHHQDFKDTLGGSRILYIWDQTTGTTGSNHPSGYTYGTEWTKAQIDAGQCTERDTSGHGTGVMGIAAGNGSATGNGWPAYRYVGMAPEADIITVRATFTTSAIIDGMNYIRNKAASLGEPCVINLSIGTQIGAHDGTDAIERAIDQISGQGIVVCTATGNNGTTDPSRYVHAQLTVPARNAEATATINVLPNRANPLYMDLWYEGDDSIDITVRTPNGYSLTKATGTTSGGYYSTPDGGIWIDNSPAGIDPYNNDREGLIVIQNAVPGTWSLTLTGRTIRTAGLCDAWIESGQNVFWSSNGLNAGSCTIPGTSRTAITVGGYRTKSQWTNPDGTVQGSPGTLGNFCTYSGEGLTRDGRQKPDLCVPSTSIASSMSTASNQPATNIVEDGVHVVLGGTSMAVPHMTGAAALLLQRDPTATAAEIMGYVKSTARSDSLTGAVPNTKWGLGKLDVQAAMSITPLYTSDLSAARAASDGTPVKLRDQVVTAGLSRLLDRFYIESADRDAGIQVRTGLGSGIQAEKGSRLAVNGVVGVIDGERAILSPSVTPAGAAPVPEALAMTNRSVGGASLNGTVPGVTNGTGPNNVGLVVKTWGTVSSVGSTYFYVDDGTHLLYPPGPTGLKIFCGTLSKPALGQCAIVTGISTIDWDGSVAKPVVRVCEQSDLQYY